jgi:uncharacterized protein YcbK (DUF882 family)
MEKLYFDLSELCITKTDIPQDVADKLLEYHIWVMQRVREKFGAPIYASHASGWRPEWYEKQRGRSGKSQHCFKADSKGAVDWTAKNLKKLLEHIIEMTPYSRICYYPRNHFIHCDYKYEEKGRFLYICDSPTSKWEQVRKLPEYSWAA